MAEYECRCKDVYEQVLDELNLDHNHSEGYEKIRHSITGHGITV